MLEIDIFVCSTGSVNSGARVLTVESDPVAPYRRA